MVSTAAHRQMTILQHRSKLPILMHTVPILRNVRSRVYEPIRNRGQPVEDADCFPWNAQDSAAAEDGRLERCRWRRWRRYRECACAVSAVPSARLLSKSMQRIPWTKKLADHRMAGIKKWVALIEKCPASFQCGKQWMDDFQCDLGDVVMDVLSKKASSTIHDRAGPEPGPGSNQPHEEPCRHTIKKFAIQLPAHNVLQNFLLAPLWAEVLTQLPFLADSRTTSADSAPMIWPAKATEQRNDLANVGAACLPTSFTNAFRLFSTNGNGNIPFCLHQYAYLDTSHVYDSAWGDRICKMWWGQRAPWLWSGRQDSSPWQGRSECSARTHGLFTTCRRSRILGFNGVWQSALTFSVRDRMGLPISAEAATSWLKSLLTIGGRSADEVKNHSCKVTALSWCAKAGLSKVYGRDNQAEPLRQLDGIFRKIAMDEFFPDATRSGHLVKKDGDDNPGKNDSSSSTSSEDSMDEENPEHEVQEEATDGVVGQWIAGYKDDRLESMSFFRHSMSRVVVRCRSTLPSCLASR